MLPFLLLRMSRWKCRPGYVPLPYVIATTSLTEKDFYQMLRESSTELIRLGHQRESHGASFHHVFRKSAVDAFARAEETQRFPQVTANMAVRFKGTTVLQ
jgi:hypothetical protein